MRTFLPLKSRSVMESLLEMDMVKIWTRPRLSDDDEMKGVTVRHDSNHRRINPRRHRTGFGSSIHVPFLYTQEAGYAHMRVRPCLKNRFQAHLAFSQLHWNKSSLVHREYNHTIPYTDRSSRSSTKGCKSHSEKPRRAPLRFVPFHAPGPSAEASSGPRRGAGTLSYIFPAPTSLRAGERSNPHVPARPSPFL